mgnify:CR=1 FL=1
MKRLITNPYVILPPIYRGQNLETLPLHGACPERDEILRYAQNDNKRRVQGQGDS